MLPHPASWREGFVSLASGGRLYYCVSGVGRDTALGRIELINRRVMGSLGAWDWAAQLASVRVPVLVIQGAAPRAGEHDEGATWLAAARDWTSSVPDARLVLVGTIPQFPWLDAHPQFLDAMRVFLSQGWPANAQRIVAPDRSRQSRAGRD